MQRDWITSPSPIERPAHRADLEMAWWPEFDEPRNEQTRPDLADPPFICRCQCGCTQPATNGLFCANCDPEGRF